MAQKDIRLRDKPDQETKDLAKDGTITNKNTDKTQVQSSPNYLKVAARRSKAGFERVHMELLRRYRDSAESGDRLLERRASFWKSKKKRNTKYSGSSVLLESGTFKSYISQADDNEKPSLDSVEDKDEVSVKPKADQTETAPRDTKSIQDNRTGNQPVVSVDADIIKQVTVGTSKVAKKPSVKARKIPENSPSAGDKTESKTEVQDPIYDVPPPTDIHQSNVVPENDKADENMYLAMDGGGSGRHLKIDEAEDYTSVDEVLQLKRAGESSGIYVNCTKERIKQSSERDATVDIYSTTEVFPKDIVYAVVNKTNKKKRIDKIEKENQTLEQYDYDYICCDEIDIEFIKSFNEQKLPDYINFDEVDISLIKPPSGQKPPKATNKRITVVPNISKPDPKIQTKVSPGAKPEANTETEEDSYVLMSRASVPDFYSFSVEEVVEVLNSCALPHIANICRDEQLDGEYFRDMNKEDLCKEPFRMNCFYIGKFFRVINGWRPKRMTVNFR